MKRVVLTVLLLTASVCVFAQNGVIKDLTGTVELKPVGTADFLPAAAGSKVNADTVISTGFKSTALVEVGSTVITVRPLTRLTLTEIKESQNGENLNLSLQTGRVRVDVKPPAGTKASVTVKGPTTTASVRGTSFYFDAMNLKVIEGTVAFKGNYGYTVMVSGGSSSMVEAYGIARESLSINDGGLLPAYPYGYDPMTMGNTGGSKKIGGGSTIGSGDDGGDGDGDGDTVDNSNTGVGVEFK